MRRASFFILHITLPLLLGGLVYLAFRPTNLLMFRWFQELGLEPWILSLQDALHGMKEYVPDWVMYNFPDGCWVWSLTSVCTWIWKRIDSWESGLWISSSLILGVASEIAQEYNIVSGVADIYDALCAMCGGVGAYLFCSDRADRMEKNPKDDGTMKR